jgi:hypothetical protein
MWTEKTVKKHFQFIYLNAALTAIERVLRLRLGIPCTSEQLNREALHWSRQRR